MKYINTFEFSKEERRKKLEEEILRKQKELELLDSNKRTGIIPLEDYTNEEKIEYFDKLYKQALSIIEEAEEDGYVNEDSDHYLYEEAMKSLNIKNPREMWKYFNSLQ